MKITTKMKRSASGEWGGKLSKWRVRNTNQIIGFIDLNKAETPLYKKKSKPKKIKPVYKIWDVVQTKSSSLYSKLDKADMVGLYRKRSEDLANLIRELYLIWWWWFWLDLEVASVNTEWKVTTYSSIYWWMPVMFNDSYNQVLLIRSKSTDENKWCDDNSMIETKQ